VSCWQFATQAIAARRERRPDADSDRHAGYVIGDIDTNDVGGVERR
jgi:hypothetical protein